MTVFALAPAKINLGLEVVRRRTDGFHDIVTVFQAISVFDRLRIAPSPTDKVRTLDRLEQIEPNLVSRAIETARARHLTESHWNVELEKRIPVAAGLGGASADAAATLLAIARHTNATELDLPACALELGSDVPFLLQGGAALASGRGEMLEPLPALSGTWLVLAAPMLEIERKTARLYGALQPSDFTDGSRIAQVAFALRARTMPHPAQLANAFERPLAELLPDVGSIRAAFVQAGAPFVALSGAGPTHYTAVPALSEATRIAFALAKDPPIPVRVLVARPVASGPILTFEKTMEPGQTL